MNHHRLTTTYRAQVLLPGIGPNIILDLHVQASVQLLLVLLVQISQQDILILLLPLVATDIVAPTTDRRRQAARDVVLLGDFGDGVKVGADGKHDAAGLGQAAQGLALGAEVVVADGAVLLGRVPADAVRVLAADRVAPGQLVVDLDEVVVARDQLLGLEPPEEVHHALFQLLAELGDVPGRVDLRQRHADLVLEPPEARQQDRPGVQVVLPVRLLDHDGQVVLCQPRARLHGVFRERARLGVEVFAGPEVSDPLVAALVEGRVAVAEVVGELFEELNRRRVRLGRGPAALGPAFDDPSRLVRVEPWVVVVQFDPVVELGAAQAHGLEVLVPEWSVGEWFGRLDRPVRIWCGFGSLERRGCPCPGLACDGFTFHVPCFLDGGRRWSLGACTLIAV